MMLMEHFRTALFECLEYIFTVFDALQILEKFNQKAFRNM